MRMSNWKRGIVMKGVTGALTQFMKRILSRLAAVSVAMFILTSCGGGGGGDVATFSVTYDGNGGTGSTPVDPNRYQEGQTVTVLENSGNFERSGYTFAGWNTQSDGNGTTYVQGTTFTIGSSNVTLFGKWTANPTYTVTYNGNGDDGTGAVPVDISHYEQGQTITVLGNTGDLLKEGYTFAGWNTTADGSGITYITGQTFAIGTADMVLYAKWSENTVTEKELVFFNFDEGSETNPATSAEGFAATGVSVFRSSLVFVSGNPGFALSASMWDLDDNYFEFSLTAPGGEPFNLTTLKFDERASLTGPKRWEIRTSADSYASTLAEGGTVNVFSATPMITADVSIIREVSSVTIRIYGKEASGVAGTWRIDNLRVYGF